MMTESKLIEYVQLSDELAARPKSVPEPPYEDEEQLAAWQAEGRALIDDAETYSLACDISWGIATASAAIAIILAIVREWGDDGPNVTFASTEREGGTDGDDVAPEAEPATEEAP